MYTLNDLHEGDNIGGLALIEIAHVSDFEKFNPVKFKPGRFWRSIEFHPDSAMMKENTNDGDHGIYYSYAGTFKIHKRQSHTDQILARYIGTCSVLRVTDRNNYTRVIGGPDFPCTLYSSADTGGKPNDTNHMSFTFNVDQISPALYG